MDEFNNILIYLLLLLAVAIGFLLGRRERKPARSRQAVIKDYYQGLNFLFGDQPELGVERFIESMEVSDETLDVHLAMASVVRRRGEVEKAIRIHQNMLSMPVLNPTNKQLVEFELARDYHQAGLLDRAEALLTRIASGRGGQLQPALELLLDLYEQEREWLKAIEVSQKLVNGKPELRARVSHYYCELAEAHMPADLLRAQEYIKDAIACDPLQPRSHWLNAQLEMQQKKYKKVLKHIERAVELQPALVGEYLETYRTACENLHAEDQYEKFLRTTAQRHPDPKVLRALLGLRRHLDDDQTVALTEEIARAPKLAHLPLLLELADDSPDELSAQNIREQINRIVKDEATLQCANCGFSSHALMWHCPTCKQWGSFD
jgi:lipopolysaccharide biosynthesis regulator YciM